MAIIVQEWLFVNKFMQLSFLLMALTAFAYVFSMEFHCKQFIICNILELSQLGILSTRTMSDIRLKAVASNGRIFHTPVLGSTCLKILF